jgi:DNA-binding IclR family transcriptional regulator
MTTLSSAADVLRCYCDERRDLTVTQVSRLLEMPKSNASRLLRAMAACGMLEPVGASKRYRPGVVLHEAGRQYWSTSPLHPRLDDCALSALARLSGRCDLICVMERDGLFVTCVGERGPQGRFDRPTAERRPAAAVAPGHALLARLDDDALRGLLGRGGRGQAPLTGDAYDAVARAVGQARRRGFAAVRGRNGETEVAVAIGDPQLRKEAALSTTLPAEADFAAAREAARILNEIAAPVAAAARDQAFSLFRADLE